MKKFRYFLLLITATLCVGIGSETAQAATDTILNGVHIGAVDVSGMTAAQAKAALESQIETMQEESITMHIMDQTFSTSAASLGYTWDNSAVLREAVEYGQSGNIIQRFKTQKDLEKEAAVLNPGSRVDTDAIAEILEDNCTQYNQRVQNMGLTRENGVFTVVEGQEGHVMNLDASVAAVEQYMTEQWMEGSGDVDLVIDVQQPKGSAEELARVKDLLGEGSTDYSGSSDNRKTNVENGVSKVAGKVLYPGDSLSMLDEALPFEVENGYAEAASFLSGEVVDSIGGGVCQVSTTLYLAVIRSELQVDTRYNHSMTVSYVKPSMDAAVAEGSKDFVFTNNTDAPIYIEGSADGSTVAFAIYGEETRDPNRTISFESETTGTVDIETKILGDSSKNLGYIEETSAGHEGLEAKLWKIITVNGQETREEFNTSSYQMSPSIYTVGTKTSDSAAADAILNAIYSNSLNKVYNAISQYS